MQLFIGKTENGGYKILDDSNICVATTKERLILLIRRKQLQILNIRLTEENKLVEIYAMTDEELNKYKDMIYSDEFNRKISSFVLNNSGINISIFERWILQSIAYKANKIYSKENIQ